MPFFRRLVRVSATLVLLLLGLTITYTIFPLSQRATHRRLIAWWSGLMTRACGVRLEIHGPIDELADGGQLLALNHVSWLDIFLVNQIAPARFVAKAEISTWPVVGTLVSRVGTVFIERGKRRAINHVLHTIAEHLSQDDMVAVFPEGTVSDGHTLLPFHGNLMQAAIKVEKPIRPIAIRYLNPTGQASKAIEYLDGTTFFDSLLRIAGAEFVTAQIHILPAIVPSRESKRADLARQTRAAISLALDLETADKTVETAAGLVVESR